MSIKRRAHPGRLAGAPRASGFALIVTLALVVLITVAVVAFIFSTEQNEQVSRNSVGGQIADILVRGATQSVIAGLQREMADGSGVTTLNGTTPVIMPLVNDAVIEPSRSVGSGIPTTYSNDPNSTYAQFVNVVKQSLPLPLYTFTPASGTIPTCPASAIPTSTASVDGRSLDATYWGTPQLVSAPAPAAGSVTSPLIPNWIYLDRQGRTQTAYASGMQEPTVGGSGALNPNYIVGRYAYNIYDIGGLLNANVAGYGLGTVTTPVSSALPLQLIPGYKGSLICADLSGLAMTTPALTINGASAASIADWQNELPKWRAQGNWVTSAASPSVGFGFLLSGGEFGGWIAEVFGAFDFGISGNPPTAAALTDKANEMTNNHFTSRQDLINWVTNQWGKNDGNTASATWILPYLTQFSYDTDAPTFSPDPNRPQDTALSVPANGGNDARTLAVAAGGSTSHLDDTLNPAFTSILDSNGNPLVKHRFPLSALSLVSPYYPGNDAPAALADQIKYDFGLYWVAGQGWVYSDYETAAGTPSTIIKTLKQVAAVAPARSPNFFELLKAAIASGSLGKQYGNIYDNLTGTQNRIGTTIYSSIDCQVIQIGANIISQAAPHYFPTDIAFTYNGTVSHFYGDKDLPYLYRTRLAQYRLGAASAMVDPSDQSAGTSQLDADVLQVELWNPHAPNRVGPPPTNLYPSSFRIVPQMTSGVCYATSTALNSNGTGTGTWGTASQYQTTLTSAGDYSSAGGPNCSTPIVGYAANSLTSPSIYITVPALAPSSTGTVSSLTAFREPCPIIDAGLPSGSSGSSIFSLGSAAVTQGQSIDGSGAGYAGVALPTAINYPAMYSGSSSQALGFVLGFFCAGPAILPLAPNGAPNDLGTTTLTLTAPISLYLQYHGADNAWHTYDEIDSAMASGTNNVPEMLAGHSPHGYIAKYADVGTRLDARTNRWGLIWDNRHGFGTYSSGATDYMGGMGPSLGSGGGDNFQVGMTGFPHQAQWFHGGLDTTPGTGLGMVGINTANPSNSNLSAPAGPSSAATTGWYGSFIPYQTGQIPFTPTDYHYAMYTPYTQTNEPGPAHSPPTVSASSMLGSALYQDSDNTCYADPDGVIRLADGGYADTNGDGLPDLMLNTLIDGTSSVSPGLRSQVALTPSSGVANFDNRPVILNRPFQSVAELGYVFRGEPWKTLDFFSPQSGDAALLDVFSAYGPDPYSYRTTLTTETGLVMGRVNLNTRQEPVLAALFKSAWTSTPGTKVQATSFADTTADQLAQALTAWTASTDLVNQGPLRNRAELVGKYVSGTSSVLSSSNGALYTGFSGSSAVTAALTSVAVVGAPTIKQERESIMRSLADVGTTRTWNLLIDLVAQTGHLTPVATGLQTFVVDGERHVWVSVAIDRVTGKVIKMQVEPVRL